jgi:hypothetical protein
MHGCMIEWSHVYWNFKLLVKKILKSQTQVTQTFRTHSYWRNNHIKIIKKDKKVDIVLQLYYIIYENDSKWRSKWVKQQLYL